MKVNYCLLGISILIAISNSYSMPISGKCTGVLLAASSQHYDTRYRGPAVHRGSLIRFQYEGHLTEGVIVELSGNHAVVVWEDKLGARYHSDIEVEEIPTTQRRPLTEESIIKTPQSELVGLSQDETAIWLAHNKPSGISEYELLTTREDLRNKSKAEQDQYAKLFRKEITALDDANRALYKRRTRTPTNGIKTLEGNGWFHYSINKGSESSLAPKLHFELKDVLHDLTPATTEALLIDLQKAGFNGELKVAAGSQMMTRFDPLVIHGESASDIEIAKTVIQSRENLFSKIETGVDQAGVSNNTFRKNIAVLQRDHELALSDVRSTVDANFILNNHRSYNLDVTNPRRVKVRGIYDSVSKKWYGEAPSPLKTFKIAYEQNGQNKTLQINTYSLKNAQYLLGIWADQKAASGTRPRINSIEEATAGQ